MSKRKFEATATCENDACNSKCKHPRLNCSFFATAGKGTETFLASEIREKTNTELVTVREGKVFFKYSLFDSSILEKIMKLRVAERVMVELNDYDNSLYISGKRAFLDKFMTELFQEETYRGANSIIKMSQSINRQETSEVNGTVEKNVPTFETEKDLSNACLTFRVSIKCSGKFRKRLDIKRLSHDVSWRIAQASGWRTQLKKPDIEVCIHINDEHVTAGVPLTKHPLSRRNYIQDFGLRAPIAWIMCKLAEIKKGDVVLDPMCGKATILLEGGSDWKNSFYVGSDVNGEQINTAGNNVKDANLGHVINIIQANSLDLPYRDTCVDVLVCDIPFNKKHQISGSPSSFYKRLLQEFLRVLRPNGRCILLVNEDSVEDVISYTGIKQADDSDTFLQTADKTNTDTPSIDTITSISIPILEVDRVSLKKQNMKPNMSTNSSLQSPFSAIMIDETIIKADSTMLSSNKGVKELSNTTFSCDCCRKSNYKGTSCQQDDPIMVAKHHSAKACDHDASSKAVTSTLNLFTSKSETSQFVLLSKHPVRLGETEACILKMIKN